MNTITTYLSGDHKRCGEFFTEAQTCVSSNHWVRAEERFRQFCEALEQHFTMEEQILFQAFEHATCSSTGATSVMRNEHEQIQSIVRLLQDALTRRDSDAFLRHSETLNSMLRQHNNREESLLYLMTDRILSGQATDIIEAMQDIAVTNRTQWNRTSVST
ncbi:hemerythrin domain-containing protein [Noviherbaspirillum massiliense]|uniref:hemerythrin domain-containing protein n=1 Tax=Noviherbaspirillum massiliense TaxID=1465823 RepID=UPI00031F7559|nr:hemerythrin domain-containing protein [Noviherbaspirillum massiliense]